jgi:hypothetical protein
MRVIMPAKPQWGDDDVPTSESAPGTAKKVVGTQNDSLIPTEDSTSLLSSQVLYSIPQSPFIEKGTDPISFTPVQNEIDLLIRLTSGATQSFDRQK